MSRRIAACGVVLLVVLAAAAGSRRPPAGRGVRRSAGRGVTRVCRGAPTRRPACRAPIFCTGESPGARRLSAPRCRLAPPSAGRGAARFRRRVPLRLGRRVQRQGLNPLEDSPGRSRPDRSPHGGDPPDRSDERRASLHLPAAGPALLSGRDVGARIRARDGCRGAGLRPVDHRRDLALARGDRAQSLVGAGLWPGIRSSRSRGGRRPRRRRRHIASRRGGVCALPPPVAAGGGRPRRRVRHQVPAGGIGAAALEAGTPGRRRGRGAAGRAAVSAFRRRLAAPAGSLGTYLAQWRFNGPLFRWLAAWLGTAPVVALAVAAGLAVAVHARRTRDRDDPAAWIWPLAAAICLLPAIYPWYLVWLIPFLGPLTAWPVVVWTLASMLTYTSGRRTWRATAGSCRCGWSRWSTAWSRRPPVGCGGSAGRRHGRVRVRRLTTDWLRGDHEQRVNRSHAHAS